jgi:hypothetical protein
MNKTGPYGFDQRLAIRFLISSVDPHVFSTPNSDNLDHDAISRLNNSDTLLARKRTQVMHKVSSLPRRLLIWSASLA